MSRFFQYLLLMLLLAVVSTRSVYSQVAGVERPEESALTLIFQNPEAWDGNKYSEPRGIIDRLYVSTGIGAETIWGMRSMVGRGSAGVSSHVTIGYRLSPIHSAEFSYTNGFLPTAEWKYSRKDELYYEDRYYRTKGFNLCYLFNFMTYAFKKEEPLEWDLQGIFGLSTRFQGEGMSLGFVTGLRAQYNVNPKLGLYVEPRFGYYGKGFSYDTYDDHKGWYSASIMGGISVSMGVDDGYSKIGEDGNSYNSEALWGEAGNVAFALKTNAVYWAMCAPNIGIEVPIGTMFSGSLSFTTPKFENRESGYKYFAQVWDFELKYWLNSRSKLQGFYAGGQMSVGRYDFQEGLDGDQSAGLNLIGGTVGYVKPLSREISLDLGIGYGIIKTNYLHYEKDGDCLVWKYSASYSAMSLTKATIGVIWTPQIRRKR